MSLDLSNLPNTTLASMLRMAGRAAPLFSDVIEEAADRLTAASQRARVSRAHAVRTNATKGGVAAHAVRTEGGVGGDGLSDGKASFEAKNEEKTKSDPISIPLSLRALESDAAHAVRTPTHGWTPGYARFHAKYPEGYRRVCNRYWITNGLEAIADQIDAGLDRWLKCEQWTVPDKNGKVYILNERDWLENRKWDDAPPAAKAKATPGARPETTWKPAAPGERSVSA